jgi:hypothetical protein
VAAVTREEADAVLSTASAVLAGEQKPPLAWFVARDAGGVDVVADAWRTLFPLDLDGPVTLAMVLDEARRWHR